MPTKLKSRRKKKWFTLHQAKAMVPDLHESVCRLTQLNCQLQSSLEKLNKEYQIPLEEVLKIPLNQTENFFELDIISTIKLLLSAIQNEVNRLSDRGCHISNIIKGQVNLPVKLNDQEIILTWQFGQNNIQHWFHAHESYKEKKPLSELPCLEENLS
jgi:hypothetical protein